MTGSPQDEFSHVLRFLLRKHLKEMLINLWPHFLLLPVLVVKYKRQFFFFTIQGKEKKSKVLFAKLFCDDSMWPIVIVREVSFPPHSTDMKKRLLYCVILNLGCQQRKISCFRQTVAPHHVVRIKSTRLN